MSIYIDGENRPFAVPRRINVTGINKDKYLVEIVNSTAAILGSIKMARPRIIIKIYPLDFRNRVEFYCVIGNPKFGLPGELTNIYISNSDFYMNAADETIYIIR